MTTHSITMISSIEELPITLTIPEAAAVLRIGRSKVYEMVGQWNLTGGAEGLRSVRLGRSLRIPRVAVLEFLGIVSTGSDIVPSTNSPASGGPVSSARSYSSSKVIARHKVD